MSRIDELIEQYCPDGVQYLELSDVTELDAGDRVTKANMAENGQYAVYGAGVVPTGRLDEWNREHCLIISRAGAGAGYVNFVEDKFWATDVCFVAEQKIGGPLVKFVFYWMKSQEVELMKRTYGGAMPKVEKLYLWRHPVPVPPIEVQREIVDILDKFTQLEAELEAELEARRKQYEHYRNELLSFKNIEGGVRWIPMGDVVRIRNGSDWKHLPEGEVPVYGSGGVMNFVGTSVHPGPSVLIPRKGSLGNLFYLDEPFWTVDTCFYTEMDTKELEPKFLYYFLKTQGLEKLNVAGGVPSLTQTMLNKVLIPLVSIEMQLKVVEALDHFDSLTSSISKGLPAEIAARRKQYEYYRDKLLTFKELEVA